MVMPSFSAALLISLVNSISAWDGVGSPTLASSAIDGERLQKRETLKARAERVYAIVGEPRFKESWDVYPFNSGYFMCISIKGADAEAVRLRLLDEHEIGVISVGSTDIRIAFSCLEVDQVEPLFEALHTAIQDSQRA